MDLETLLTDNREISSSGCANFESSTNCYCNCHFNNAATEIHNTTDALISDELGLDDCAGLPFDCGQLNSNTSFSVPTEKTPPEPTKQVVDIIGIITSIKCEGDMVGGADGNGSTCWDYRTLIWQLK
ncbi:hypothetical protein [Photobacterium leiognathi]|uniref:hypothetical protein n=1 Tax=Photobacterium leiognathi TaxID=553611 RepID=UPI002980D165|nr:hypothetical protein [Photobacterium leiognathi]